MSNLPENDFDLIWCDHCEERQPAERELLKKDDLNGDVEWGDICCAVCHFVIATVSRSAEFRSRA